MRKQGGPIFCRATEDGEDAVTELGGVIGARASGTGMVAWPCDAQRLQRRCVHGFSRGISFRTANADHQVEAYDPVREDVWDLWERCQGLTPRGRATDFSNRYEEYIAAAVGMGSKLFRFSTA